MLTPEMLNEKPTVCAMLYSKVKEYFTDEEHEAAFREWYLRKYGHEYEP